MSKDIEFKTLSMELATMLAKNALLEEMLADSVPLEQFMACVAENESMSAEHTSFMYSLAENDKMNRIDFGDYIEDVLRKIHGGNQVYRTLSTTESL